ncbi:hypothetical protein LCGC14_0972840 [marine sediment metagenome]|uniref:Uncharacterized protein n=1 Tax=marine sediment metagenome TaxID=412755 RepID=A0A0F9NXA1_9ZZZZ
MNKKDSTAKILEMHKQERKLLIEHLASPDVLALCVIESTYCKKACPQKRKHGKLFDWGKHCCYYLGEKSCEALSEYDSFYRELKHE